MELRQYQIELAEKGELVLNKLNAVYLAFEMRVGKTATAFEIARRIGAKRVLFVTIPIHINGIERDYKALRMDGWFKLEVQHYHYLNLQKLKPEYDLIICDEAQKLGGFPKPTKAALALRDLSLKAQSKLIYLSGTPTPESYSQIYHQFWISFYSPFKEWPTFYKWAKAGFVDIFQRNVPGHVINDYSRGVKSKIDMYVEKYFITYTQAEADFKVQELHDQIVYVPTTDKLKQLSRILINDRVYQFKNGIHEIVCANAASLQRKVHQIYSGTVIAQDMQGKRQELILESHKADYIHQHYYKRKLKIAIFYLFQAEGELLKQRFPIWTDDPYVFNGTDHNTVFIGQLMASARGINLSSAKALIFYNIPFSSEVYQQVRQRAQERDKTGTTRLYWLCTEGGIEEKIYNRVINKQTYTLSYFRRDYGIE